MRAERINVSHFDFITIKEFIVERKIGDHAYAKIMGYIHSEKTEEYKRKLLDDIWVTITASGEGEESKILMTGIIAGFSLNQLPHSNQLTLEIMSGTYLMDGEKHFRTFQNREHTYADVITHINENYYKSYGLLDKSLETTPYHFLLQYQETDWQFLKRLSSHFGLLITPSIVREGVIYHVENAHYQTHQLPENTKYLIKMTKNEFVTSDSSAESSSSKQCSLVYSITVRDIYDLWDVITFGQDGGYIYKIQSQYRHEELIHTYFFSSLENIKTNKVSNSKHAGCSFEAVIKEVKQDKVQISVLKDENSNQEITVWFPYSTGYSSPDGPAWYCMPEVGDYVRLQIPDEDEQHGYVISAVHKDTGSDRKNPDYKSFKTKYGKELLFTPETLELTNNQGISIKIIDNEGIKIISDKNITIESGENLTLSSEKASLMIVGTKTVDIKQGNAGLQLNDDVTFSGGKFRIQ